MTPLRRRNILETLLKLAGASRLAKSPSAGPGCTCESCVQAWGRHQPVKAATQRERKGPLRLELY